MMELNFTLISVQQPIRFSFILICGSEDGLRAPYDRNSRLSNQFLLNTIERCVTFCIFTYDPWFEATKYKKNQKRVITKTVSECHAAFSFIFPVHKISSFCHIFITCVQ